MHDSAKLELSFGSSEMYISETSRAELRQQDKIVLPTHSALFLGEYLFSSPWGGMAIFNLPLESQKMIVNGQIVEERASPYLGLGARWSPILFAVFKKVFLQPQFGIFGGTMIRNDWSLAPVPVAAGRLHLSTQDGFTMYFGGFYTIGVNAPSFIYGAGHRF